MFNWCLFLLLLGHVHLLHHTHTHTKTSFSTLSRQESGRRWETMRSIRSLWGDRFTEDRCSETLSFAVWCSDFRVSYYSTPSKSQDSVQGSSSIKVEWFPSQGVMWQWHKERLGNTAWFILDSRDRRIEAFVEPGAWAPFTGDQRGAVSRRETWQN